MRPKRHSHSNVPKARVHVLDPNLFVLLATALLAGFLLRRTYRRVGRRKKSEPAIARVPRPEPKRRKLMDVPELAQYEVQMHETARELSAILDSKIVALQVLTQQAQQKIDHLERLLNQLESGEKPAALAQTSIHYAGEHAQIYALADQGYSHATIAHRTHTPLDQVQKILAARK